MNAAAPRCRRSFFPEGNFNEVRATEVRDVLRDAFARYGLPQRFRVDNGSPWGSSGDLPPDLALWILGLGVELHWNTPNRPQENGVVERSQGTAKRWADPAASPSVAHLQKAMDGMDAIHRESYPVRGDQTRINLWPSLKHSGRKYTRSREGRLWKLSRVLEHLSGYAVVRRVDNSGRVSLYNRSHYVGTLHSRRMVYVMLDPNAAEWIFCDEEGRQLRRMPAKQISASNVMNLTVSRRPPVSRRKQNKAAKLS